MLMVLNDDIFPKNLSHLRKKESYLKRNLLSKPVSMFICSEALSAGAFVLSCHVRNTYVFVGC